MTSHSMSIDDDLLPDVRERRSQWFERYVGRLADSSVVNPARTGQMHRCPCCLFWTLAERGGFGICKVCYWEDDGQDENDADEVRGGPNGGLSLSAARQNFAVFGACEERFKNNVRPVTAKERSGEDGAS